MTVQQRCLQAAMISATLLSFTGCHLLPSLSLTRQRTPDPAWPMSLSSPELIELINNQNRGLASWRCDDTVVTVHMKGQLPQRLNGSVLCEAPSNFRLKASNLIARADLGSNTEKCWLYMEPGDPVVLTWRHEDAALLQHAAPEIPRLDPQWLMAILGVSLSDHDLLERHDLCLTRRHIPKEVPAALFLR